MQILEDHQQGALFGGVRQQARRRVEQPKARLLRRQAVLHLRMLRQESCERLRAGREGGATTQEGAEDLRPRLIGRGPAGLPAATVKHLEAAVLRRRLDLRREAALADPRLPHEQ